jgi:DNA-directed RNA polymerase alpha subunit
MNPQVKLISDENNILKFTLNGVNVSLANALRRTILSDIPLVVFKTSPYEENKAEIIKNTSRLNNEIIKQRLSCIPIHIKDAENFPYKNYIMEVNVENITDTTMYVTSEQFVVKDLVSGKLLDQSKTREIFPPDDYTGKFIDFVRLRPKVFEEMPGEKIPGEKIHLTCKFTIGTAKEDGSFNAASTCSYGFTVDKDAQDSVLQKKIQTWKDEGKKSDEIDFESKNWLLLDGLRIYKKDSFDFTVESVGIHSNYELLDKACDILIQRLDNIDTIIEKDEMQITNSLNTLTNSFDILLENDDYTIGKILEYFMYTKFYETEILTFCGFKKMHPHDPNSIIRVSYKEPVEQSTIKGHLKECVENGKSVFLKMKKELLKFVKR